ncbi:MAG: TMEM175 family protein [Bifidobacteriaceae bacterium]|jgi:uncharacterized membrane protein|nr:TMEM175 family protein [Bifidobacteriaceae bacterium]
MKKFKERFDAFSDAVIAILLTIMVLELPIEVVNGTIDYASLFQAIGIYFISFCMVGNVWYRHALAFNQIKEVPNHIIVLDFVLIMFLSLIPAFTRLMVVDVTNITVMLYGGDYMLVLILQDIVTQLIVHTRYSDRAAIRAAYNKILGRIPYVGLVMQAAFLAVGYWYPTVALVFYIVIPVESFLMNARRQQDFQDVEELDSAQLTSYLDMPADKQREFKRKMRDYRRELQNSGMSRSEQRDIWRRQMSQVQEKMREQGLDAHGRPLRGGLQEGQRDGQRDDQRRGSTRDRRFS